MQIFINNRKKKIGILVFFFLIIWKHENDFFLNILRTFYEFII